MISPGFPAIFICGGGNFPSAFFNASIGADFIIWVTETLAAGATGFSTGFCATLISGFFVTRLATGFAFCGFVLADFFNATVLCTDLAGLRTFTLCAAAFAGLAGLLDVFAVFATGRVPDFLYCASTLWGKNALLI
jgi:hypothetical protein